MRADLTIRIILLYLTLVFSYITLAGLNQITFASYKNSTS
jgi:hypothetical protein